MKKNLLFTLVCTLGLVVAIPGVVNASEYTVKSGDTLWSISQELLGNGAYYNTIFEANKDIISNPDVIAPGLVLNVDSDVKPTATVKKTSAKIKKNDVFKVTADDYQVGEIYLGTKYKLEATDSIADYFITANPEVAEVVDGAIIPKGVGAAYLWVLNASGDIRTCYSIAVLEPEARGVWCYDDQYLFEVTDKTISSVYSSDENVATAYFIKNTVFATGNGVGQCVFDITYEDGSTEQVKIDTLPEWITVYTEYGEQARQIVAEKKMNQ